MQQRVGGLWAQPQEGESVARPRPTLACLHLQKSHKTNNVMQM